MAPFSQALPKVELPHRWEVHMGPLGRVIAVLPCSCLKEPSCRVAASSTFMEDTLCEACWMAVCRLGPGMASLLHAPGLVAQLSCARHASQNHLMVSPCHQMAAATGSSLNSAASHVLHALHLPVLSLLSTQPSTVPAIPA